MLRKIGDTFLYSDSAGLPREADLVGMIDVENGLGTTSDIVHLNGVTEAGAVNVLEADPLRTSLTIRNDDDTKMYMRVDGGEAADRVGYPLDAGRGYAFDARNMLPSAAISVYCGTAGKHWAIMYTTSAESE